MQHSSPLSIVDILRNTLRRLEQSHDFRQDDSAVIELKRHIVQSIAELEVMHSADWDLQPEDAVTGLSRR
jgi:hypothetical protein